MIPQPPFPFAPPAKPLRAFAVAAPVRRPLWGQLYFWVLVGVSLGVAYGYCFPTNPAAGRFTLAVWTARHLPGAAGLINALPAGLAFLVGIDRFMSEARAITNVIGNGLATLIIAKSEGALDYARAEPVLLETAAHPRSQVAPAA